MGVDNGSHKAWINDLQKINNIISKAVNVKVTHGSQTFQGRLNLDVFRCILSLELRKIPLHLTEGLNRLRSRLRAITCCRCLHNLQELFEFSGGDMSSALSWSALQTANLSHNNISELDMSLRLVPVLEHLDLSHNNIQDAGRYIEYLTELKSLNLSFNLLSRIPTFAFGATRHLRVLVLKNNSLESITDLQELVFLEELDLSNNCLLTHHVLQSLKSLAKLQILNLSGNPLSLHRVHRLLTLKFINSSVSEHLKLDGFLVTSRERRLSRIISISTIDAGSPLLANVTNDTSALSSTQNSIECSLSTMDCNDTPDASVRPSPYLDDSAKKRSANRKRTTRRVVRAIIDDFSESQVESGDERTAGIGTSSINDGNQRREEDWLRILAVQKMTMASNCEQNQNKPVFTDSDAANKSEITDSNVANKSDFTDNDALGKSQLEHLEAIQTVPLVDAFFDTSFATSAAAELSNLNETDHEDSNIICSCLSSKPLNAEQSLSPLKLETANKILNNSLEKLSSSPINASCFKSLGTCSSINPECSLASNEHGSVSTEHSLISTENGLVGIEHGLSSSLKVDFDETAKDRIASEENVDINMYRCEDDEEEDIYGNRSLVKEYSEVRNETVAINLDEGSFSKQNLIDANVDDDLWTTTNSDVAPEQNFGPESDIFIVSKLNIDEELQLTDAGKTSKVPLIVSVTDRFILEKNINGDMVDYLDMRCLLDIKKIECDCKVIANSEGKFSDLDHSVDDSSKDHVYLAFNYLRRDRKKRKYIMENSVDTQVFIDLLSPNLSTVSKTTTQQMLQCLKCALEFPASEETSCYAPTNMRTLKRDLIESAICPQCRSSLVVQLASANGQHVPNSLPKVSSKGSLSTQSTSGILSTSFGQKIIKSSSKVWRGNVIDGVQNSGIQHALHENKVNKIDNSTASRQHNRTDLGIEDDDVLVDACIADESTNSYDENNQISSIMLSTINDCGLTFNASPHLNNVSLDYFDSTDWNKNKLFAESAPGKPSVILSCSTPGYNSHMERNGREAANIFPTIAKSVNDDYSSADRFDGSLLQLSSSVTQSSSTSHEHVQYDFSNFKNVDHRLKLYLTLKLLADDEELDLVLRCDVVRCSKGKEFPALLVCSNTKLHILRITGEESATHISRWLKVCHVQQLHDLRFVDICLGFQSFRLDFGFDSTCHMILVRDEKRCQQFMKQFSALMAQLADSQTLELESIAKGSSLLTANNMCSQVLLHGLNSEEERAEVDVEIQKCFQCFRILDPSPVKGTVANVESVTVPVTNSHVCLAQENYAWLPPRDTNTSSSTRQFTFIGRQKINNIVSVELSQTMPLHIRVYFQDELSTEQCLWHLQMSTLDGINSFIDSIKLPWEQEFQVNFNVSVIP